MKNSEAESLSRLLITEQEKFKAVFYGMQAPLVIFKGPNFIIEECNTTYQAIYPGREILGKPIFEVISELRGSRFPGILKEVYETGQFHVSREGMATILNVDTGRLEERYFDTTFSRISYGKDEEFRIIATPREVTDRVEARKGLETSLQALKLEEGFRAKFTAALSHDLRSPLTVIRAGAELLQRASNKPELVLDLSGRMLASINRAERMIRDILDADRINAGQGLPVTLAAARIDEIAEEVVRDLKGLYGDRFVLRNEAGGVQGTWDRIAIHRIIDNLASNAVKYGDPDALIQIAIESSEEWVEISIHNEGNPIPEEERAAMFFQYHRSKSAISSGQKGWGVGLTIVQGLVEAHQGSVRVESDAVNGTTFTVRLPRASA